MMLLQGQHVFLTVVNEDKTFMELLTLLLTWSLVIFNEFKYH